MAPFSPPEAADPDRRHPETCPLDELADLYESAFAGVHAAEVGLGRARESKARLGSLFAARLAAEARPGWYERGGRRYKPHRDLRGVERERVEPILPAGPATTTEGGGP